MKQGKTLGRGCVGGLAALALLTHCGGVDTEAPEEAAESLITVRQAVTRTFPASADARVEAAYPTSNFGTERKLVADLSPERQSYLRFDVQGVEGRVTRAVLRLFALDGTSDGPRLHETGDGWTEQGVTWNERPLLYYVRGDLGAIPSDTWVEYDVTASVHGNGPYSFALVSTSGNGADFASREYRLEELRPQLVLTVEDAPGCMPRTGASGDYCTYRGTGGGFLGWTRRLGGLGPERLHALATDTTGGFATAGQFGDAPFPGGTGFSLARYRADGAYLWDRQVTTEDVEVSKLTVTPEGNILVVGTYGGSPDLGAGPLPPAPVGTWARALFVAKFSPIGETVWTRGFVATYVRDGILEYWPVFPRDVATDAQGSLIVTGDFHGIMDLGGGPLFAGDASVPPKYEAYQGGFLAKFSWEGQHLWSRVFENWGLSRVPVSSNSVATDSAGNILVGGRLGRETDLGSGDEGTIAPFIARYDASGFLQWKKLIHGINGEVTAVGPLGLDGVAFIGDFAGQFTFAGQTYTVGDLSAPGGPYPSQSFFGTLSSTEGDGWLRMLELGDVARELVTDGEDTVTVTGYGDSPDLGGGEIGEESTAGPMPFVARYSRSGEHRWSRVFDRNFEGSLLWPRLFMGQQPGGSLVLGSDFSSPVDVDGIPYTSRGATDLFFFQLEP